MRLKIIIKEDQDTIFEGLANNNRDLDLQFKKLLKKFK